MSDYVVDYSDGSHKLPDRDGPKILGSFIDIDCCTPRLRK